LLARVSSLDVQGAGPVNASLRVLGHLRAGVEPRIVVLHPWRKHVEIAGEGPHVSKASEQKCHGRHRSKGSGQRLTRCAGVRHTMSAPRISMAASTYMPVCVLPVMSFRVPMR
jgi:hypothetical protein